MEHPLYIDFDSRYPLPYQQGIQLSGGFLNVGTNDETAYPILFQDTAVEQRLIGNAAHRLGQRRTAADDYGSIEILYFIK